MTQAPRNELLGRSTFVSRGRPLLGPWFAAVSLESKHSPPAYSPPLPPESELSQVNSGRRLN